MKDETASVPILQFVGLRAKLYSYITACEETKKAKGVNKYVVKMHMRHADYCDVLDNGSSMRHSMNMFRS